jgi:phosphopantothenoylcysteine synthetase/decarboxylase
MPRLVVLLTAGGTHEPLDEVRSIRNTATGALPAAMAEAWLQQGAHVIYLHGPGAVLPGERVLRLSALDTELHASDMAAFFAGELLTLREHLVPGLLTLLPVTTAADALRVLRTAVAEYQPKIVACAMAVADFSPEPVAGKLASRHDAPPSGQQPDVMGPAEGGGLTLHLRPTEKVIDAVRQLAPHCFLLGFKLLAGASEAELLAAAGHLGRRAGCDLVFTNDIRAYQQGIRQGALVNADGSIAARLDGGSGPHAHRALAQQLVRACQAALLASP